MNSIVGRRWMQISQKAATQKGFTLIELMITIVMMAIVLTVAAPSFSNLIRNNRMTADANRFLTSMMFARSEAVKRSRTINMTATGGSWTNGWIVWVDFDADGTYDAPPAVPQDEDESLRIEEALNPALTLTSNASPANTEYEYAADGNVNTADTLNLCDSTLAGETGRQITLLQIGQVRVNSSFVCP